MPHWAIYSLSTGALYSIADAPPNVVQLQHDGLCAAYFGEDKPDLNALEWCPKRLSFIARRGDALLAEVAGLEQRFRAELAQVTTALQGLSERVDAVSGRCDGLAEYTHDIQLGFGTIRVELSSRLEACEASIKGLMAALQSAERTRKEQAVAVQVELAELRAPKPGLVARMFGKGGE